MRGNLKGRDREDFNRSAAATLSHETCTAETSTAKMGCDSRSVVERHLKVYGSDNLRIAEGSILPRVTTEDTMAPASSIGERAGEMLKAQHRM
jgi:choline dehydrogenase